MHRGSDWNHYSYQYGEGQSARIRFDTALALQLVPSTHQTCIRLILDLQDVEAVDVEGLAAFEDQLSDLLDGVDCLLVGVMVYGARQEFVFQVDDVGRFDAHEPDLTARAPYPSTVLRSRGWDFFDDRICPGEQDWQRISDREAVERLLGRGADPSAPHPLSHAFFGDADKLEPIRERLIDEGFAVSSQQGSHLVLVREQLLVAEEISVITTALARFARSCGATYEGWRVR